MLEIILCDVPFTLMDLHEHYSHQPSCRTLMSEKSLEVGGGGRRSEVGGAAIQGAAIQGAAIEMAAIQINPMHETNSKTITQKHSYNHIVIIIVSEPIN